MQEGYFGRRVVPTELQLVAENKTQIVKVLVSEELNNQKSVVAQTN